MYGTSLGNGVLMNALSRYRPVMARNAIAAMPSGLPSSGKKGDSGAIVTRFVLCYDVESMKVQVVRLRRRQAMTFINNILHAMCKQLDFGDSHSARSRLHKVPAIATASGRCDPANQS